MAQKVNFLACKVSWWSAFPCCHDNGNYVYPGKKVNTVDFWVQLLHYHKMSTSIDFDITGDEFLFLLSPDKWRTLQTKKDSTFLQLLITFVIHILHKIIMDICNNSVSQTISPGVLIKFDIGSWFEKSNWPFNLGLKESFFNYFNLGGGGGGGGTRLEEGNYLTFFLGPQGHLKPLHHPPTPLWL